MEKSIKSIATNYGLYLGGALALFTVIAYAIDIGLLANTFYGIVILLVIIVFGIISVAKSKAALDGFLSFKEAFSSYFVTILVGLLISTVVSYILFNFVDPEAANTLKELTIEKTVSMMEGFGTPVEAIAEAVDKIESQNQYSIGNIAKGLAGYLVFFSIIGLIVAAIMKKSNPDA